MLVIITLMLLRCAFLRVREIALLHISNVVLGTQKIVMYCFINRCDFWFFLVYLRLKNRIT